MSRSAGVELKKDTTATLPVYDCARRMPSEHGKWSNTFLAAHGKVVLQPANTTMGRSGSGHTEYDSETEKGSAKQMGKNNRAKDLDWKAL